MPDFWYKYAGLKCLTLPGQGGGVDGEDLWS